MHTDTGLHEASLACSSLLEAGWVAASWGRLKLTWFQGKGVAVADSQSDPSTPTDAHVAPGQTAVEGDPAFRAMKDVRKHPLRGPGPPLVSHRAGTPSQRCRVWEGESLRVGEQHTPYPPRSPALPGGPPVALHHPGDALLGAGRGWHVEVEALGGASGFTVSYMPPPACLSS